MEGSGVGAVFLSWWYQIHASLASPLLCLYVFMLFLGLFLRLPSLFPSYINASLFIPIYLRGNVCHFPADIHLVQVILTIFLSLATKLEVPVPGK